MANENVFQGKLIVELKQLYPGIIILKNDPDYRQGIPDLILLYQDRWAALEVKKSAKSSHQPNQDWYIQTMADMSYAAFIYPENKEDILDELQFALRSG